MTYENLAHGQPTTKRPLNVEPTFHRGNIAAPYSLRRLVRRVVDGIVRGWQDSIYLQEKSLNRFR